MVGRGAFRFGRSSPPRFPRTRRGSGRACGVSRRVARRPPRDHPVQTVGAGPPRSPRGKAGMGFALKYQYPRSIGGRGRGSGVAPISSSMLPPDMLRRRSARGLRRATARFKSAVRADIVPWRGVRWHEVTRPLATGTESGGKSRLRTCARTGELLAKRFAANRGFWLRARRQLVGRSTFVTHHRTALDRHVRIVHPRRELDPGVRGEAHRAQVRRGEQEEGEEGLVRTIDAAA